MIDQVCELSDAINPGVCWPTDFLEFETAIFG